MSMQDRVGCHTSSMPHQQYATPAVCHTATLLNYNICPSSDALCIIISMVLLS